MTSSYLPMLMTESRYRLLVTKQVKYVTNTLTYTSLSILVSTIDVADCDQMVTSPPLQSLLVIDNKYSMVL